MVSKGFKLSISERKRNIYRLENKMKKFMWREDRLEDDVDPIIRNIYQRRLPRMVHSLFTRYREDRCIVDRCYAAQLGYIYIKNKVIPHTVEFYRYKDMWVCNKRKIPYCLTCFERWINPNNTIG